MKLSLRWVLGVFAFGSLVACMVPDVTKKADEVCGANDSSCAAAPTKASSDKTNSASALQASTGAALPATTEGTRRDAGAPSGSSAQSGDDAPDAPTFSPVESDAGAPDTTATIPASCDKLLDCCVALRTAGRDTDADKCDTSYSSNEDFTCYDAQYGYANPTDGTTGACVQP